MEQLGDARRRSVDEDAYTKEGHAILLVIVIVRSVLLVVTSTAGATPPFS